MAEEKKEPVRIRVVLPALPLPPSVGANYFHFSRLGQEFQMLVGYINLTQFHEIKQRKERDPVVTPDITHRFMLSSIGFEALRAAIDQIAKSAPKPDVGVSVTAKNP